MGYRSRQSQGDNSSDDVEMIDTNVKGDHPPVYRANRGFDTEEKPKKKKKPAKKGPVHAPSPDDGLYAHLPQREREILKSQIEVRSENLNFFSLYRYATAYDFIIVAISAIMAIVAGVAQPLFTIVMGKMSTNFGLIGAGLITHEYFNHQLGHYVLYYVYLGIAQFFTVYISMVGFMHTGEHITQVIREKYLEAILRQNIGFFDKQGTGEITTRITADTDLIQMGLSEKVGLTLQALSTFCTGFIIAFIKFPKLAGICSSTVVAIVLIMGTGSKFIVKYGKLSIISYAAGGSLAEEVLSSIRSATAFGNQDKLARQYEGHLKLAEKWGMRLQMTLGVLVASMFSIMFLNYGLGFWQGGHYVAMGEVPAGNVITILMSILMGSFSLGNISPNSQAFTNAVAAATKIFATIDRESPIDPLSDEGIILSNLKGDIQFNNVKHIYPSRPDVTIMKGMTLTCRSGTTTALVGPSGSGKSTAVGLVERFYLPVQGNVTLDGVDLQKINLRWLRQQISIVSQEPILFGVTIAENIRYGLIGTRWEHEPEIRIRNLIENAAKMANAHDFIMNLPEGYETNVGQRGFLLSGGQKQRIAIARAVVSDPKILLLDEATSALDTKSEGVVQAALDKAAEGRTTIVIAHRLSTVKNAHNIVCFVKGEIVEQGTHDALLSKDGVYAKLVNAQKITEENDRFSVATDDLDTIDLDAPPPAARPRIKTMWRADMGNPASMFRPGSLARPGSNVRPPSALHPAMRRSRHTAYFTHAANPRATMLLKPEDEAALGMFADDLGQRMDGIQPVEPSEYLRHSFIEMNEGDTQSISSFILAEHEPEEDVKFSLLSLIRFIFGFNARQWRFMVLGMFFAILAGCGQPTQAFLYAKAISAISVYPVAEKRHQIEHDSSFWSLMFLATGLVQLCTASMMGILFAFCSERLVRNARSRAFRTLLRQDINFFDREENSVGAMTSFLAGTTKSLAGISGQTLGTIMMCTTTLTGSIVVALSFGWKLALVCMVGVPLLLGCGFYRFQLLAQFQARSKQAYASSASYACEAAGAIRTVAALSRERDVLEHFHTQLEAQTARSLRSILKSSTLYAASLSVVFFCIALGFWWGGTLIGRGEYDVFHFFAQNAAAETRTLFEREPPIDTWSEAGEHLHKMDGMVEFRNVHFRYPTRPHQPVLRGLDLAISPGQYVALVGPSGCGKSTTIGLLERFYDVLSGGVYVDGKNIMELNVNSYRDHIGLVSQEPTLYQGTVRENIMLGAEGRMLPEGAVEKACRDANIYDFIMSLPEGFDTVVGNKGGMLSGGQKQRVAIARALLRNPRILLLDEATSALDSESEKIVQEALDAAARGRTTIAVAHRLSSIQNADIIYVFEAGKVVEAGNHTELMRRKGRYYELVQLQSLEKAG
ncbi:hypothetical protein N7468_004989 [Penicillium chermesinum]|uniref:Uncharacterized protein n=1 Tax=Penicillium chermesinum TaxID=63820 RepID=A0A9W9P108_9EURO|nr:uncharacterized protein N7468_004989 [Penicillium chermesinum]KAJ5232033.1 hypothetical protein N7468_004989 [Penicillium chermesinum]